MSNPRPSALRGWSPLHSFPLGARARHLRSSGAATPLPHEAAEAAGAGDGPHVIAIEDALLEQARDLAQRLLTSMDDDGRRWRHTQAVAARAAQGAAAVAPEQVNLLLAACWLHDIGYAPEVVQLGFHPLDGAHHLQRALWPPALVGLVAHHSGARFMAEVRGLGHLMAAFDKPGYWTGPVADALTWADQTTGPDGRRVTAHERIAEVLQRHGPDSAQARSHAQRGPALLEAVAATEQRLRRAEAAPADLADPL